MDRWRNLPLDEAHARSAEPYRACDLGFVRQVAVEFTRPDDAMNTSNGPRPADRDELGAEAAPLI
jgi:hypothetical protein